MLTGCGQSVPAEAAQGGPGIQSISFSRTTADGNDSFDFSIWQLGEAYYFSDAAVIGGDGTAEPVSRGGGHDPCARHRRAVRDKGLP